MVRLGLAEAECSVTASEGELWGCSTELGGNTFTGSLQWELSHYQLYTHNRDSSTEPLSTPCCSLTPLPSLSLCCSHELFAPASLGQHLHLQPAQWLHDRPSEAWATSASSTCLHHPCQVSYSRAHTSGHFPGSGEETSDFSVHQRGLLQLHHQRCQADCCLSRAGGADPSHDTQEVQDPPGDWWTTTGVVRRHVASELFIGLLFVCSSFVLIFYSWFIWMCQLRVKGRQKQHLYEAPFRSCCCGYMVQHASNPVTIKTVDT